MKIEPLSITVRELVEDYSDDGEGGVRGFGGLLDIRPPYQREFVYKDKQREAVISSVNKKFPLNAMYWAEREDGMHEIIDGQQRTISICQYCRGDFSVDIGGNRLAYHNLQEDQKDRILNYELTVYSCNGTNTEKLDWYKTINIAGEVLTEQELLNAVYAGPWLADARRFFSRPGGPAYGLGKDYLTGRPIRQEYLKTAIKWISEDRIEDYMSKCQHDPTAVELWSHFQSVISWVKATFPKKRPSMKGVDWGTLYKEHGARRDLDPKDLEAKTARLHKDDDVTKKAGIYAYLLGGKEKHLNIRKFTDSQRETAFERQDGICSRCKKKFPIGDMEADHIKPWSEGGKTIDENCQMLCRQCNREKSNQ